MRFFSRHKSVLCAGACAAAMVAAFPAIAADAGGGVETVVVTSQKVQGDVQTLPIAVTALSQTQLTTQQIAGGPDLVKSVPNLTFSKTNFTGYNIEIRGIGTQAVSATTDPAVAIGMNDIAFIRNHFFEQEFFDLDQAQVLRGPQGTLYGRNATAGVVNLITAKPTDQFQAMASVDVSNYSGRRLEGMLNIPIIGDKLDLRVAGEWTVRDGYTFDQTTDKAVDGRDLWSGRASLLFHPIEDLTATLVWEHFSEDDDRMRSAKQLCEKDPGPDSVGGVDLDDPGLSGFYKNALSQGCKPTSLYSASAYETPNGFAIPFVEGGAFMFNGSGLGGGGAGGFVLNPIDPYASQTQPRNLRVIQSAIEPNYRAKSDVLELNADYNITPTLTLTSQTGYDNDQLRSTEDYNRFNTAPGLFATAGASQYVVTTPVVNGVYCDPQLGCSSSMVAEDLSQERSSQFTQELRLTSSFDGPLNFSVGANYTHYQTLDDYYTFFNLLSLEAQLSNGSGPKDYGNCYALGTIAPTPYPISPTPYYVDFGNGPVATQGSLGCIPGYSPGTYIDPNPISSLNGNGHNYFRSENPYHLNSWAGFGEVYYQILPDLKLTGGLRWTEDQKKFWDIPSWTFLQGGGYPVAGIVKQSWGEVTGRFNASWSPKLDFTDASMFYASYSRGYKGGGANPPGPEPAFLGLGSFVTHPATFAPEFVDAFELGTKNTLLDGSLTLDADVFYYAYKGYQISQIVDRTSVNLNFDAKVKGAELEATWQPLPGLSFNLTGGYEDSSIDKGQSAVDLMDRTAGQPGWVVVKPYVSGTSNCILPASVVATLVNTYTSGPGVSTLFAPLATACNAAYGGVGSTGISQPLDDFSEYGVTGFDPASVPNGGAGFSKNLGGNKLPNMPPFTLSLGAQYTMPLNETWTATLRGDGYWQGNSFARVFNDRPYDQIHGYTNVNLSVTLADPDGWQAMFYVKNLFDTTAITGAFLNSDDSALTTNVFLTDPRLFGVRINKSF
ncbi:MAG: TonB-dependent receptor [Rhizomicrobium sp.]